MKKVTVADVMRAEHKRLGMMLMALLPMIDKNPSSAYKKFNEFRWNVEKHFFVEEKAIFSSYSYEFNVGTRDINLMNEHKEMRAMLADHDKTLSGGKRPNFSAFKSLILNHQAMEDEYFYTGLEEGLDEKTKAEIIKKTMEIIRVK